MQLLSYYQYQYTAQYSVHSTQYSTSVDKRQPSQILQVSQQLAAVGPTGKEMVFLVSFSFKNKNIISDFLIIHHALPHLVGGAGPLPARPLCYPGL